MNLGLIIRKIRQEKGIKQEELANSLNISQGTLSKIENGEMKIDFYTVINIITYTKTSITYFLPTELLLNLQIENPNIIDELNLQKEINLQLLKRIKTLEQDLSKKK